MLASPTSPATAANAPRLAHVTPPLTPPLRGARAPSVHFDSESDDDGCVSPASPVLRAASLGASSSSAAPGASTPGASSTTTATTRTHTTPPATSASTGTSTTSTPTHHAHALPASLTSSPRLARTFSLHLRARIATLRLLLLDADGAPAVPLDHLRMRMQLGRGKKLTKDYAAEYAANLLHALEQNHPIVTDEDRLAPNPDYCPLHAHHPQLASELAHASIRLPTLIATPLCPCSLCCPTASDDALLSPTSQQTAEAFAYAMSPEKNDYHNPHARRLVVWEERVSHFLAPTEDGSASTVECIDCARMRRRRRRASMDSEDSEGVPGETELSEEDEEDEQVDEDVVVVPMGSLRAIPRGVPRETAGGDDESDSGSDQHGGDSDDDEDDDDAHDHSDSNDDEDDNESESAHHHRVHQEREEAFLDEYMIKLHELFGLLEVNAKVEEIVVVPR
ncbi:hypothetical protein HDU98_010210 [Podochytrium sp. JEL0797]|nr:hypothetical protein HDU98_010210 [Podochytrium sp. JEL0797]